MAEIDIQRQIIDYLKANNIFHWRVPLGGVRHGGKFKRNSMAGHPDIAGILPNSNGRYFAIEIKTKIGKPSEIQIEWIKNLKSLGAVAFIARDLNDVICQLEAFSLEPRSASIGLGV